MDLSSIGPGLGAPGALSSSIGALVGAQLDPTVPSNVSFAPTAVADDILLPGRLGWALLHCSQLHWDHLIASRLPAFVLGIIADVASPCG